MWFNVLLIILICVCFMTDVLWRKIYNVVLLPVAGLALALHFMEGGLTRLGFSLFGFAAGLCILIIPFLLGGMGGGDVKLLAVIGALKGATFALVTSIYMALLGGLIALAILLFQRGAWNKIKKAAYFMGGLRLGIILPLGLSRSSLSASYPYGIAIAGGALASLLLKGWI